MRAPCRSSDEIGCAGGMNGRNQLGGFAADPPSSPGAFADISNDQLVQAMAGFGGGSASDGKGSLRLV
jgi:hypothetical protein